MSRAEIETSIKELLDKVPENVLNEVYDYLRTFEGKDDVEVKTIKNLKTILNEDRELLEKLAK